MAGSQNNYWGHHDLHRVCFGLSPDLERNLKELQPQHSTKEYNNNISPLQSPFYSNTYRLIPDNLLVPSEGDQVVPSSQKRTLFGGQPREPKPLPPPPNPEELMSDEAADSEVEFFTSDRRRLLPKSCPKPVCRGSSKDCGQVNHAYQEGSLQTGDAGIGSISFSWPSREDRAAGRGGGSFAVNNWSLAVQREDNRHVVSGFGITTCPTDKPQVPPRIPIPPKPPTLAKAVSPGEEDKPPKIPPRVPLVPPCPPRTPSPKSLPIYINGVMPATQSFAANPKYVSKALQRQQNERVPLATQFSPCIVPILKDGRQASATHYILLPPGRPPHTDRRERPLSEPSGTRNIRSWQRR